MVRDSGPCQKARFSLAEDELSLWLQCRNAAGVIGVEMCEIHRPRMNLQTGELRRQIGPGTHSGDADHKLIVADGFLREGYNLSAE